jgi:Na+-transporting NADH:ubiquinone oxidoreductase subunit NqrB
LLRVIFVGVSVAVVALAWVRDANLLQVRLTPDPEEVRQWWIPFLGTMAGGFAFGLFLRFILGKENHVFRTIRSWLSVVGMLMLVLEVLIFLSTVGADTPAQRDFLHYWQCVELVIVSAYFGTRA